VVKSEVAGETMKNLGVFHLFAIHLFTISLALIPASVRGQDVVVDVGSDPVNDAGFSIGWDSVQDRVVLSRDVTSSDAVAAKILGVDGSRVLIKPLKFLPGAQFVDIWSAAPAPDGGAVLATIVGYGPKGSKPPVKAFLMSFDGGGNLAKLWNVEPYHQHLIAVDSVGNIFALGQTGDTGSYPLLTKYSRDGEVLGQFLSSSQFKKGDEVVSSGSPNGENQMFVQGEKLYVWIAWTRQLFRMSTADGRTEASLSLAPALERLESSNDGSHIQVLSLTTTPGGNIVAQVQLWPKDRTKHVERATVKLSGDGSNEQLVRDDPRQPMRLLMGTSAEQKLVYRSARDGKLILSLE
jgi:hypothetical protein